MFDFFRRPAARPLSDAIRQAMDKDGMTGPVSDPSKLQMVESGGRYSDRKVTYFRVFDPSVAAQSGSEMKKYKDFDMFPGLVLRSGHVESDGAIILTRPVTVRAADSGVRTRAGRAVPVADAPATNGAAGTSPRLTFVEGAPAEPVP